MKMNASSWSGSRVPSWLVAVLSLIGSIAGAESLSSRPPKIAPVLVQVLQQLEQANLAERSTEMTRPEEFSTPLVRIDRDARLQVYVHVDQIDDTRLADLRAAGLAVEQTSPQYGIVQGWISFERVQDLAVLTSVRRIRPPDYAMTQTRARRLRHTRDAGASRP